MSRTDQQETPAPAAQQDSGEAKPKRTYRKRTPRQTAEKEKQQETSGTSSNNSHERRKPAQNRSRSNQSRNDQQSKSRSSQSRHSRRNNQPNREPASPKLTREELESMKVTELRAKAQEMELQIKDMRKKADLVEAIFTAAAAAEGFVEVAGILDLMQDGYGFLRTEGYLPGEKDVYVSAQIIKRSGLRKGDHVTGVVRPRRSDNDRYASLTRIREINGMPYEEARNRPRFADLTPIYPEERLVMEHGQSTYTGRAIDLVAPIGKGQRGLIVSPPKAGKTTILKKIAESIAANDPDVHLMCLLVDERPEEVTDMQRSIKGEVIASTFDMPSDQHIAVSELVIERAKRLVETGKDVVILLDSITRLARAYNLAQPASGRILSGGVDSTALYPPKRFFGAARNIEHGGSLTILASALVDTGSKMDEVIFEEFKGTGNMELKLDRDMADKRIFPAIDPIASGTRKEELLLDSIEAPMVWGLRRILANMPTERAMSSLLKSFKQTATNREFLVRSARKAQETGANMID